MNISNIRKGSLLNNLDRFFKWELHKAKSYGQSSSEKDGNQKEKSSTINVTTGTGRENKESAKEDQFFYKQSVEQLKALKDKFTKNKPKDSDKDD